MVDAAWLVLRHELAIWDSPAIVEYLAERFPEQAIWPADVAARARARSVAAETHSSFDALRGELPFDASGREGPTDLSSEAAARAERGAAEAL